MPGLIISVSVTDYATPAIGRASAFIQGNDAKELIGRVAVNAFGANYDRLNSIPNALGGPRTNYYSDARKATNYQVSGDTVTIVTAQIGIALHYYGGTVTPGKNNSYGGNGSTKYLTIPARPECHGKRASDFPEMIVLWGKKGPYGLGTVEKVGLGTVATKPKATVYFWLVSSVTLQPDPSIIPTEDEISDPINEAVGAAIAREFEDEGGGS